MSNRYGNQNKNVANKGFPKTQKRYIPKTEQSIDQTLSNSLRQSVAGGSGSSVSSSRGGGVDAASRVKLGESGEWVPNKIQSGNFVNYLPQDEAVAVGRGADEGGLDPLEAQRVVDLLNRELLRLLKLKPRDFWKEVASDTSLNVFLESFLKFRSRWYDFPYRGAKGMVAGVIVGEFELCRRVFMVLYRISSNRDPGARAADSLSHIDHSAILQEKKLLNLPKLMDICALFSHENEDITRTLVENAIKAQPSIHDDLTNVVSQFLSIVHTMYQRCTSSLEVLSSSPNEQGFGRLCADYLEVMDFINDAVVSMDAFVCSYKHAAIFFSCPVEMSNGNEEVLTTLMKLHDSLLPSLLKGFRTIYAAGKSETANDMLLDISISLQMLSVRIVNFGWKLVEICYLSDEVFQGNLPLPSSMKMFPANIDDPFIRADILIQSLKDLSGDSSVVRATFLQKMEYHNNIMNRIDSLQKTGWISMDEQQIQFLSKILKPSVKGNAKVTPHHVSKAVSGKKIQVDEETVIMESKISQIKDLFPDYGKGFLAACLEVYNQNPEEVIQRILECTLHDDLQSLDVTLETVPVPPPKLIPAVKANDKGKGKLVEFEAVVPVIPSSKQTMKPSSEVYHPTGGSSKSSSAGRFVRKGTLDVPDSETLNCRDEENVAKTSALALQLEYEDEYDDSFDDLGLSVGDAGLDEADEDMRNNSTSNQRKPQGQGQGQGGDSKWGSQKKPQFYVKDGKNYSYKVEGSVAVANLNEAKVMNQTQREQIHGLGRGGNMPFAGGQRFVQAPPKEQEDAPGDVNEGDGQSGPPGNFRGRGGRRGGGGGGGGGRNNNYRKDRAMKKHFSGLTNF